MNLKNIVILSAGAGMLLASVPSSASAQGYAIEYRVFRGSAAGKTVLGPRVVTASFADPVLIQAYDPSAETKAEADRLAVLKSELAAIYKLADIEMVRANKVAWDGKKESLCEVILIDGDYLPISLSPKRLQDRRVSMTVEVRRYRGVAVSSRRSIAAPISRPSDEEWMAGKRADLAAERFPGEPETPATGRDRPSDAFPVGASNPVGLASWDSIWGSGDRIADSEMTARLDETVVLGFPLGEASYFVSFRVGEPPEDRFWREIVDRVEKTERSWPSGLAVPPKPRFRLIPAFPKASQEAGVEGIVVLKVRVDAEGRPSEVAIVKGRAFALNQAAVSAMKQWRFEPFHVDGKAVETTFFISFDFKLGAAGSKK